MIFVDTSGWFSFFVPAGAEHQSVRGLVDSRTQLLITSDFCIDETLTLLLARHAPQRAINAGHFFFHRNVVRIHYVTANQINRAWILFQQRAQAGWSFTDCTSKIVIDDLNIRTAVALDDHFRQFGNVTVVP